VSTRYLSTTTLFQCVQRLFGRLWLACDTEIARGRQYLCHAKATKLLLVCDDHVEDD